MFFLDALRPKPIQRPAHFDTVADIFALKLTPTDLGWVTGQFEGIIEDIQVLDILDTNNRSQPGYAYSCCPTCSNELLILNIYRQGDAEAAYTASMAQTEAAMPTHLSLATFMINHQGGLVHTQCKPEVKDLSLVVSIILKGESHVEVAQGS